MQILLLWENLNNTKQTNKQTKNYKYIYGGLCFTGTRQREDGTSYIPPPISRYFLGCIFLSFHSLDICGFMCLHVCVCVRDFETVQIER